MERKRSKARREKDAMDLDIPSPGPALPSEPEAVAAVDRSAPSIHPSVSLPSVSVPNFPTRNLYQHWVFTYNNPPRNPQKWLEEVTTGPDKWPLYYISFQLEKGAERGTEHFQGYAEFIDRHRLSAVRRLANGGSVCHWEPRRGTPEQARAYSMKETGMSKHIVYSWVNPDRLALERKKVNDHLQPLRPLKRKIEFVSVSSGYSSDPSYDEELSSSEELIPTQVFRFGEPSDGEDVLPAGAVEIFHTPDPSFGELDSSSEELSHQSHCGPARMFPPAMK